MILTFTLSMVERALIFLVRNSSSCMENNYHSNKPHPQDITSYLWSTVFFRELRLREGSDVVPHLLPGGYGQLHQPLTEREKNKVTIVGHWRTLQERAEGITGYRIGCKTLHQWTCAINVIHAWVLYNSLLTWMTG